MSDEQIARLTRALVEARRLLVRAQGVLEDLPGDDPGSEPNKLLSDVQDYLCVIHVAEG